jgi:hypothetical protein
MLYRWKKTTSDELLASKVNTWTILSTQCLHYGPRQKTEGDREGED